MKRNRNVTVWWIVALAALGVWACSNGSDGDGGADGDLEGETGIEADEPETDDGDADPASAEEESPAETDAEEMDAETIVVPHDFIYEVRTPQYSVTDDPYEQEFTEYFRLASQLPDPDVRSMALIDGTLYVATPTGLYAKGAGQADFVSLDLWVSSAKRGRDPADGDGETPEADPEETGAETDAPAEAEPEAEPPAEIEPEAEPEAETEPTDDWMELGREPFQGRIPVAFRDHVELVSLTDIQNERLEGWLPPVTALVSRNGRLIVGTADGVWEWSGDSWMPLVVMDSLLSVRALALSDDGKLYIAAEGRDVMVHDGLSDGATLSVANGDYPDSDVRALAACGDRLVIATRTGVAIHRNGTKILKTAGRGGLPAEENLTLACNGTHVLVGQEIGATLFPYDFSKIDHYSSMRWVLDNRVPAVALDDGPVVWTGGKNGVTRIYRQTRTLEEKEVVFNDLVNHYWRLNGFFAAEGATASPWDDPSTMTKGDKDNDGLWTQMMIGGWCMAYAATGNDVYRQNARRALENMYLEVDVPAVTFTAQGKTRGFVARSLIGEEETELWNRKVTEAEHVERPDGTFKEILRWNEAEYEGKRYLWKADTSSDEYAGHFFGYPIYFDLCADSEEKTKIASYIHAVASYIIDGGYLLIDLDGTRTMHGHWNPDTIVIAVDGVSPCLNNGYSLEDCMSALGGGGWLNSLEVLGMMLAAFHVTGDTKFYDAYEYLIGQRYAEVAVPNENTYTITSSSIANHSDHELAMLAYTTLIRYEFLDSRRRSWVQGLEFLYDYERFEANPWWTAVMALSGGTLTQQDVLDSRATLRDIPDDVREWLVDNYYRKDYGRVLPARNNGEQGEFRLPYDEIPTVWWNGTPNDLRDGGAGNSWKAPTFWLLPYYMNLYAGLIRPSAPDRR